MSHGLKHIANENVIDQTREENATLTPFDGAMLTVRMPPLVVPTDESTADTLAELAFSVLAPSEHGLSHTVAWQEAGLPPLAPEQSKEKAHTALRIVC